MHGMMYSGMRATRHGCCVPREARRFAHAHYNPGDDPGFGFGVRRPLRFLAWKLELSEQQVGAVAAILSDLKTERAQDAVENRRALSALADAVAADAFDASRASEAAGIRVKSAERLEQAVVQALSRLHAVLQPEQRVRLAYLLRTGTLTM